MQYRKDIEGLRAIAVVPVVLYHVAQSFLPGGFVGVDIFFVISGYLISSNIFEQSDKGSFTILSFYERRIRRIAPAYLFLLFAVSILVVLFSFPAETRQFGWSVISAVLSVSNFYFWSTANYFGLSAEELPLLHTWSLAVEEQFYLIFPVIIVYIRRYRHRTQAGILLSILLASLAGSAIAVYLAPVSAFYLLPTRAWELLMGTVLAWQANRRKGAAFAASDNFVPSGLGLKPQTLTRTLVGALSAKSDDLIAIIGLGLIASSMVLYNSEMPFPGLRAIPPCLGAAMIIHAGRRRENIVSHLLGFAPMQLVGKISYSLYLWHWPILVFQRMDFVLVRTDSRLIARGSVILASFICALLSWWFVERWTRNRTLISTKALVIGSAASALALCLFGAAMIAADGFPNRFSPEARAAAAYLDYDQDRQFRVGRCFLPRDHEFTSFDQKECLPNTPGRPNYLVFGDSHAAALSYGLRSAFPDANVLQISGVGCPPLIAMQRSFSPSCPALVDLALNQLPASRKISEVWLVARWNLGRTGAAPGWNRDWLAELRQTIEFIRSRDIEVVLVGPMPEYQTELPRLIAQSQQRHDPNFTHSFLTPSSLELDQQMQAFAKENAVRYVSLAQAICHDGQCLETDANQIPLLFDSDHLDDAGSVLVASLIKAQLGPNRQSKAKEP